MKTYLDISASRGFFSKAMMIFVMAMAFIMPLYATAQTTTTTPTPVTNQQASPITTALCNAINLLTGPVGRTVAILVVISLAVMLFIGKVSWGLAIAVAVGMGVLFGAPTVVTLLSGGTNPCEF